MRSFLKFKLFITKNLLDEYLQLINFVNYCMKFPNNSNYFYKKKNIISNS